MVADRRGVEDHDVGEEAAGDAATPVEAQVVAGERAEAAHRVRQLREPFVADVVAEQPRERAVRARVRV